MNIELLGGLVGFCMVSSITPGPNNLMLMASGANFGFRRTIPHMLGVGLGFGFMVLVVGTGLMGLFNAFPVSFTVLQAFSVVYLLYLAYKIGTAAAPTHGGDVKGRPFNFLQAAAFQWVNPKAWTMALTSIAVYAPSHSLLAVLFVACVFALVNLPCVSVWTVLGERLRVWLRSPTRLRIFNWTMAAMLVVSLYPVISTHTR